MYAVCAQEVSDEAFNTADSNLPYSTAELTQAEYSTDDFRMFAFKVSDVPDRMFYAL